ncbi:MAG: STAS domain-containing protein [Proteobacteria bacterium]|nr:STAS domain-containing protein [Pseudomonadota bacterium]
MKLDVKDLNGGAKEAILDGRLDVQGSLAIDGEFAKLAADSKNLLVDLSSVSFLASLGIRMLVSAAKALSENNGSLVLLNPQENVAKVLSSTGIDTIIPVKSDRKEALAVFGG